VVAKLPYFQSISVARPDDLKKGIDLLEQSASIMRATLAQLNEVERQLTSSIRIMTKVYETVLGSAGEARSNGKAKLSGGNELMSPDEVARELNISRGTLWRMRTDGRLPQPVRVSLRKLAYRRSEIVAWLESGGASSAETNNTLIG
jgi:predicted DNA-binding transcriptional regulator AlpA